MTIVEFLRERSGWDETELHTSWHLTVYHEDDGATYATVTLEIGDQSAEIPLNEVAEGAVHTAIQSARRSSLHAPADHPDYNEAWRP